MKTVPVAEQSWLVRFFGGSNALQWEGIVSESAPRDWLVSVTPWLDFLSSSPLHHPLLLPVFGTDGTRYWYAMAPDDAVAAQMLEEVRAFIGPSFTKFSGHWHDLSSSNDIERALKERFAWRVLRLDLNATTDLLNVEQSIARYRSVLSRRLPIPDRAVRPFAAVRTDFDLALLAGNAERAQSFLDELVSSGRIGADQHQFLRVRLLAGLGRVEELVRNRVLIESVMNLALPPQIVVDLVESLYEVHIEPHERRLGLSDLGELYKQHIARPFGALFRERKGIRRPRVLRAFLLFEAGREDRDTRRSAAIVQTYPPEDSNSDLIQEWFQAIAPAQLGDRADRVRQAILDEDYPLATSVALEALPERWAYSTLLRCAQELPQGDLHSQVISVIQQIDPVMLASLNERDRARYARLTTVSVPRLAADAGWLAWANEVNTRADEWTPLEVLSNAAPKWDLSEYAADPQLCTRLANLIGNASEPAASVFRDAFPALVDFFVQHGETPTRAFIPLYSMLIKVLAWSGPLSASELEIGSILTRALLGAAPDKSVYSECLRDLQEVVTANNAPTHLDWALGLAELLVLYPTDDPNLRLRLFLSIFEMCRAASHRLSETQRAVLVLLAKDYQCPDLLLKLPPVEREGEAQGSPAFSGLIGIYTLNEAAGQRARSLIAKRLPGAVIELNSDLVASDRLRHLAKSADIFVFAWKTSTHQAFYCVKDARKDGDIVLPPGGGTASLVKAVLEKASWRPSGPTTAQVPSSNETRPQS
jgi:hypothetical protein